MKKLLALAVLAALAAPLKAAPLESSVAAPFSGFSFAAFKFVPSVTPLALKGAAFAAASVTILDIQRLYAQGSKVSQAELTGWFAGRRFSGKGATAQLLVGADVLRDPASGSLGGSDFKLASMGGAEPDKYTPADLYDDLGNETVNAVQWYIREEGSKWKNAEFLAAETKGQDTRSAFELRKSGDLLVAKYADGTFGYFFKKVR